MRTLLHRCFVAYRDAKAAQNIAGRYSFLVKSMNIIISNSSGAPIYKQIVDQIKSQILSGELKAGEMLPSMRNLAIELHISLITTKRAYEELEQDGYIETIPGRGCYVREQNLELVREDNLRKMEHELNSVITKARLCDVSIDELIEIIKILYNGDGTNG